ncbi:MAG: hypothetical protein GY820_20200 [Gammaproteobacteria bacterium]|nr:hypothetical protein [Gammaproteobacteria bacterium]
MAKMRGCGQYVELTPNNSCETQAEDLKLCFSDSAVDLTSIDGKKEQF